MAERRKLQARNILLLLQFGKFRGCGNAAFQSAGKSQSYLGQAGNAEFSGILAHFYYFDASENVEEGARAREL